MSKPIGWRDFTKSFDDLSSDNFPALDRKTNTLQDTFKFKFSSRAQKNANFDASIKTTNREKTDAEFNAKLKFQDVEGLEVAFKAKNKPSLELNIKLNDKVLPVDNATLGIKILSEATAKQSVGATVGFSNDVVNANVGYTYPITKKLFDFIEDPKDVNGTLVNALEEQKHTIDFDLVAKPVEDRNIFVGAKATIKLDSNGDGLLYDGEFKAAVKEGNYDGAIYAKKSKDKEVDKKTQAKSDKFETTVGASAYTTVDDVSGGAQFSYTLERADDKYKGFAVEAVAGIRRDADSNLSTKLQIIPDTILSIGYDQKINSNVKFSFGYAFLLAKATDEKTKTSAYQFGIDITH